MKQQLDEQLLKLRNDDLRALVDIKINNLIENVDEIPKKEIKQRLFNIKRLFLNI